MSARATVEEARRLLEAGATPDKLAALCRDDGVCELPTAWAPTGGGRTGFGPALRALDAVADSMRVTIEHVVADGPDAVVLASARYDAREHGQEVVASLSLHLHVGPDGLIDRCRVFGEHSTAGVAVEVADRQLAAWELAAIASVLRDDHDLHTDLGRRTVLEAAGLVDRHGTPSPELAEALADDHRVVRGEAIAVLLGQAVRAARGETGSWTDHPASVMLAQGRASAATGQLIALRVAQGCTGLLDRLADGGRVLDVGTGVGALALELAIWFPSATVDGIDSAETPLQLSEQVLAGEPADVVDRIRLTRRDVTELDVEGVYDLVWFPAPFIALDLVDAAWQRVVAALRPGGWLIVGTNPPATDPRRRAVEAWSGGISGGCGLTAPEAVHRCSAAGLLEVRTEPTAPGGPVLVLGRRPPAGPEGSDRPA